MCDDLGDPSDNVVRACIRAVTAMRVNRTPIPTSEESFVLRASGGFAPSAAVPKIGLYRSDAIADMFCA